MPQIEIVHMRCRSASCNVAKRRHLYAWHDAPGIPNAKVYAARCDVCGRIPLMRTDDVPYLRTPDGNERDATPAEIATMRKVIK